MQLSIRLCSGMEYKKRSTKSIANIITILKITRVRTGFWVIFDFIIETGGGAPFFHPPEIQIIHNRLGNLNNNVPGSSM